MTSEDIGEVTLISDTFVLTGSSWKDKLADRPTWQTTC